MVRSFIDCINFYRKFISDFSKRAMALKNLTKDTEKFAFSAGAQNAFDDLKQSLTVEPCLALPYFSKEFHFFRC